MADKRIIQLTEKQSIDSGDFLAVDNSIGGTKKIAADNLLNTNITVKTATLAAGSTSVTFTSIPTTGNNTIDLYSDTAGVEFDELDDSTSGQLTYTFTAQESAINLYLVIKEVS